MDNGTVRVLLIEDDPDDYYLIRELLGDDPENKIVLEWVSNFDAGLDAITLTFRKSSIQFPGFFLGGTTDYGRP